MAFKKKCDTTASLIMGSVLMISCSPKRIVILGSGGMGAKSGTPGMADGARGDFGDYAGKIIAKNLALDGSETNLEASMSFAFPDQCRMLLNHPNKLFFCEHK